MGDCYRRMAWRRSNYSKRRTGHRPGFDYDSRLLLLTAMTISGLGYGRYYNPPIAKSQFGLTVSDGEIQVSSNCEVLFTHKNQMINKIKGLERQHSFSSMNLSVPMLFKPE